MNSEKLEININQPSSPLVPLNIYNSIKEINIPVEIKIETINTADIMRGGGENTNTDNSIFGYFKSFFRGFSQQSIQKKKHDTQNKSYLNSLFYEDKKEPEPEPEPEPEIKENENLEITKIILLTTENPEMVLRESLKGTKLYYLAERKDLPSQWV